MARSAGAQMAALGGPRFAPHPPRPGRYRLGLLLGAAAAVLLLGTGGAFLASAGTSGAVVTAPALSAGSGGGGLGAAVAVTPVSQTITVSEGRAQLVAGQETARIAIASGATGTLLVNAAWLDPQDAYGVLNSPHAFILVGLYQEDTTSTSALTTGTSTGCPTGEDQVTDSVNGTLCLSEMTSGNTLGTLTRSGADVLLHTPVSSLSDVYVLTSIYSGNIAPPGQQASLPQLQFYVGAQLVG